MNKWLLIFFTFIFTITFGQENVNVFSPSDNITLNQNDIKLQWNLYATNEFYIVQISKDEDFNQIVINVEDIEDDYYVVDDLPANEKYYWRVKSTSSDWSVVRLFYLVDFKLWDEIEFILDPDSVVLDSNNKIQVLKDLSGNNYNFEQLTASKRPSNITLSEVNSTLIDFNPLNENSLSTSTSLTSLEEGEIFSFIKVNETPAPSKDASGIWRFSNLSSSSTDHYPYTNNGIYFGFGRSSRSTIGDISNNVDLTVPHILNLSSADDLIFRINNIELYSSSSGSVSFPSESLIGASYEGQKYFNGQLGQVLMFNTVLSDSLRDVVNDYYRYKYAPPVNLGRDILVEDNLCGFTDTLRAGKHFIAYEWSDGSTADSLVVNEAGKYWVEVEDVFGNVSSDTIRIQPKITYPSSTVFCEGETITWEVSDNPNFSYQWSNGETGNSIDISSSGDYYVTLTDANNCSFVSETISIFADPFPSSFINSPSDLCSGNIISLHTDNPGTIDYLWSTGETTSSIEVNSSGTYSVFAENENGCIAEDELEVNIIGEAPVAVMEIDENICIGQTAVFSETSYAVDNATITSVFWDFDDNTTTNQAEGYHTFTVPGTYEVVLTATTDVGCSQTDTTVVTIHELPNVSIEDLSEVCQKTATTLVGVHIGGNDMATWEWDFGDGNTASSSEEIITHAFPQAGNYEITVTGTDAYGCVGEASNTIEILPGPTADFGFEEVCDGTPVKFHDSSTVELPHFVQGFEWNFGEGAINTQKNPTKAFTSAGVYPVTLTAKASNGCWGDTTIMVPVHSFPQEAYSVEQACAGLETVFTDETTFALDSIDEVAHVSWLLNGIEIGAGEEFTHVFDEPGVYDFKQVVVSNYGCEHSGSTNLTIHPPLSAAFSFTPEALIADYPIVFESTGEGATTYDWTFGDFATSSHADTTIVFDSTQVGDTISISLITSNEFGCSDTTSIERPVYEETTDLELEEFFLQDEDGFYTFAVRLRNNGTTPINEVDLKVKRGSNQLFKEVWIGSLYAGEDEIYVFSSLLSSTEKANDSLQDFLCVEGRIAAPTLFEEEELSNNIICQTFVETQPIIIQPYPNPVKDEFTISILSPKKVTGSVVIFDNHGREVVRLFEDKTLEKGVNEFVVNSQFWGYGSYYIRLESEVGEVSVKVVK